MNESTETLTGCAGGGSKGCPRRPEYAIDYVVNPSMLPGLGEARRSHACLWHVHAVLKVAIPVAVAKHATVSQYEGR